MRRLAALAVAMVVASTLAVAQGRGPQHAAVLIPDSSVEHSGERGLIAHTNHVIRVGPTAGAGPNGGLTPAQVVQAYALSTAGSFTFFIVDAFHYPTALKDFHTF